MVKLRPPVSYANDMIHPTLIVLCSVAADPSPMVLDGHFNDWTVPISEHKTPAVSGCGTSQDVYLQLLLDGPPVNLQGLDTPLTLSLDWDSNAATGNKTGHDVSIIFSPGSGRNARGVQVGPASGPGGSWDTLDFIFAPTTASNRYELRLPRTLSLSSGTVTASDSVGWTLSNGTSGTASTQPDRQAPERALTGALAAAASDDIRVVTWNLVFGNVLHESETVTRLLSAIKPHVLLLQEIESDQRAADILAVLRAAMPGERWTLRLGPVGGRIRSGIATRLTAWDVPAFQRLSRKDSPRSAVRAAALIVAGPGSAKTLCVSTHLKCCGVAGSPEDMKRIGEVEAIRRGIETASSDPTGPSFDAVMIGGDMNLVGSTLPMDLLIKDGQALVGGRGDLLIAEALQPDGRGMQTWQEDDNSYSPGRLDWIVFGGKNLAASQAIVLDTLDLDAAQLTAMSLKRTDTETASDHLPVVVDLTQRNDVSLSGTSKQPD